MLAALVLADPALAQKRPRDPKLPPPGPAPRAADGHAVLGGATKEEKGVFAPLFGITEPISPAATVPFQPWAKALFDYAPEERARAAHALQSLGHGAAIPDAVRRRVRGAARAGAAFTSSISAARTRFASSTPTAARIPSDLEPSYYGHSIGWWEGDTLVVDSTGFNESFWLDRRGLPHTVAMHTVERFKRTDSETIAYEITVHDPGAYTADWTGGFNLQRDPGVELFEYVCQQANYAIELMVGGERSSVDRSSPIVP